MELQSTDTTRPTPWGRADYQAVIAPGVAWVNTPGHGGFLIGKAVAAKILSPAACRAGANFGRFLAYEEDCDATIVLFEHPEWMPLLGMNTSKIEVYGMDAVKQDLLESLSYWRLDYLRDRGIEPDAATVQGKEDSDKRLRILRQAVQS